MRKKEVKDDLRFFFWSETLQNGAAASWDEEKQMEDQEFCFRHLKILLHI